MEEMKQEEEETAVQKYAPDAEVNKFHYVSMTKRTKCTAQSNEESRPVLNK